MPQNGYQVKRTSIPCPSCGGAAQIRALRDERIHGLQLNDAPAAPEPDLGHASMTSRFAPGEGAVPLAEWLRELDAIGCRAPLGVEVFSTALSRLPPAELGRRLHDSARRALRAAPGEPGERAFERVEGA